MKTFKEFHVQINEEVARSSKNNTARDAMHSSFVKHATVTNHNRVTNPHWGQPHSRLPFINHTGTHHVMTMFDQGSSGDNYKVPSTKEVADKVAADFGSHGSVHVVNHPAVDKTTTTKTAHGSSTTFARPGRDEYQVHVHKDWHKKSLNESDRGLGTHSFGREPSTSDYIKGLNSASERSASAAKAILKKHAAMKGTFAKPVEKHGMSTYHGKGDYEGYSQSHYTQMNQHVDHTLESAAKSEAGVHIQHGRTTVGSIRKSGDTFSAAHPNDYRGGDHISHTAAPKFDSHNKAIKFLIARHKDSKSLNESVWADHRTDEEKQHPAEMSHKGKTYYRTGKFGHNMKTNEHSAEYSAGHDKKWRTASGTVSEG